MATRKREPEPKKRGPGRPRRGESPSFPGTLPPTGNTRIVRLKLTRAHMRIIETEAAAWGTNRGHFLELLLKAKLGLLPVNKKARSTQKYQFTKDEIGEWVDFAWYLKNEDRLLLEQDMRQTGILGPQAWVSMMLNHWIGCPMGWAEGGGV